MSRDGFSWTLERQGFSTEIFVLQRHLPIVRLGRSNQEIHLHCLGNYSTWHRCLLFLAWCSLPVTLTRQNAIRYSYECSNLDLSNLKIICQLINVGRVMHVVIKPSLEPQLVLGLVKWVTARSLIRRHLGQTSCGFSASHISRRHCEFHRYEESDGRSYWNIIDLGSTGRTFVNGFPIPPNQEIGKFPDSNTFVHQTPWNRT